MLCAFSSSIRPITNARASRKNAFGAGSSAKPEPHQRRQWEGANVRQKNPSPQTLQSPQWFVSVLWLRHAQLRDLVEVWALTGECSPPDRNQSIFFFVQSFVDFALSLPGHSLWVCLHPRPWIFSQKRQIRTRSENLFKMPDFRDSFTARSVCEGVPSQISVFVLVSFAKNASNLIYSKTCLKV